MMEISPGLWHWSARHERIGVDVSSYYLESERVVLDPMIPAEGLEWFEQHGSPEDIVLTNRHHDRHSWQLHDAFGSRVHCVRSGVRELEGRGAVEVFDFGDQLPGGITAYEIGAICPDETALHIPSHAALACADGVVHYGEELGFVPEQFIDEPERTKPALQEAYARLLDRGLDFDVLLLAHGTPVVRDGKEALRAFAAGGS
jgi:glyoxylase-like metal-dependent hydrolase (beta-lactamase superfamily II)